MPNVKSRKRPCSICRKWFLPDVRQKERQRTCSKECSRELHRRQCATWNKKNSADYTNNYLSKKLEKLTKQDAKPSSRNIKNNGNCLPRSRINLNLPRDVLYSEVGKRYLIIIEYLIDQILSRTRGYPPHKPKLINKGF